MKSLFKLTLVTSFALLSCTSSFAQWSKKVKGNGNVTTKTIKTGSYDQIKSVGSMDVTLVSGTEGTITVKTDENLHEYIEIETNGSALVIKIKNNTNISTKKGIHVTVPFESIDEVTLTGSGDITTKNPIKTTDFDTSVTGSGDLVLDINAQEVNAKVTGSGDLTLVGTTNKLEVKVTGSGDFHGEKLNSADTEAYVSGSGDAKVAASKQLKARVHGSGDIRYIGDPERRDTKVSGSGSIKAVQK